MNPDKIADSPHSNGKNQIPQKTRVKINTSDSFLTSKRDKLPLSKVIEVHKSIEDLENCSKELQKIKMPCPNPEVGDIPLIVGPEPAAKPEVRGEANQANEVEETGKMSKPFEKPRPSDKKIVNPSIIVKKEEISGHPAEEVIDEKQEGKY